MWPTCCCQIFIEERKTWFCNQSFSFLPSFFSRSTRSRAVRSTKRESSSSSWLTWSRTTDGSDAPSALFLFLTLECSLSNCVERQPSTTVPPLPTVPNPLLGEGGKKKRKTSTPRVLYVHTPTCSSWNWTEPMTLKRRRGRGAADEKSHRRSPVVTSKTEPRVLLRSSNAFGFDPSHTQSLSPSLPLLPHRTTLTSDCGDMATTMRRELDFTEMTLILFPLLRPSSETDDVHDFGCFNVICYSFNFWVWWGFGLMADGCYWLAFYFLITSVMLCSLCFMFSACRISDSSWACFSFLC